jgi:hypothetical protein
MMASFPSIFKPNIRQVPLSRPAATQFILLKTVLFTQKIWISKLKWFSVEEAGKASWNQGGRAQTDFSLAWLEAA